MGKRDSTGEEASESQEGKGVKMSAMQGDNCTAFMPITKVLYEVLYTSHLGLALRSDQRAWERAVNGILGPGH
jgi:hypothetical protein